MAIYEYQCNACGRSLELVRPMSQADGPVRCPSCGGAGQRLPSVFASTEDSRLRVPARSPLRAEVAQAPPAAPVIAGVEAAPQPALAQLAESVAQSFAKVESTLREMTAHAPTSQPVLQDGTALVNELVEIDRHLQEMQERQRKRDERLVKLEKALVDLAAGGLSLKSEAALANELAEIDRHLEHLEQQGRDLAQRIAALQVTVPGLVSIADLTSLADKLTLDLKGRAIPERLVDRLVAAVERLEEPRAEATSLDPQQQEAARLEADLERLRRECARLSDERASLEAQLSEQRARAQAAIAKVTEDASTSISQWAEVLRRELDSLLRETLDLVGKAAHVESDLRSREWLTRLLALLEGKDDLAPGEVLHLARTILGPLSAWAAKHDGALPPTARADLEHLVRTLQGTGA
ncbi:MAG: hypothetical protein HYY01_06365 [Chloroflexi bacterium]|nr:hypothetical protein [Chloroflexota bacterium]